MSAICTQYIILRQLASFTLARVASDCELGTLGIRAAQTFTYLQLTFWPTNDRSCIYKD